jgi:uncharacterized membrane protein YqjE
MAEANSQPPGLMTLFGRLFRTIRGAAQNRLELFAVEWQEERARLTGLLIWGMLLLFLGIMGMLLLTATIIFLFREDLRIYVAAIFAVLYLLGAVVAFFGLKSLLKQEPFAETIDQAKKDRVWLESLK